MVTVKKETIKTSVFEKNILASIKKVKGMDFPEKEDVLKILRELHNGCLEWSAPEKAFEIIKELK